MAVSNTRNYSSKNYDSLKQVSAKVGQESPDQITSVLPRKYTATLSQVLNMNDTEIQWAIDPLGHTQAVHSNHYRQRSTFIERVKMAKLMYLQDMNLSPKVKEKGLDDSELNVPMNGPQSCDTFVALPPATADGCIIFGKNSDRPEDEVQEVEYYPAKDYEEGSKLMCTYIEIDQALRTYAVILSKPAWMWGAEMGSNEHGLCIGNEAVWTKLNSDDDLTERLLGMDIVRLVLERAKTAKEGVVLIGELLAKYGQGGPCFESKNLSAYHNSFLLADSTEAWVVETADRLWAAEQIKEGVRNISNQLSIGIKIDMMSPNLLEEAKKLGLYRETQGQFDFFKSFSDDLCLEGRYVHGKRLLKELSKEGKFGFKEMATILRDEESGICMIGGYAATGSQISVLPPVGSKLSPVHWFTATPNPKISVFKPFIFTPNVEIGTQAVSPKYGQEDPRVVRPRFQKHVDRRHELYKAHSNFFLIERRRELYETKSPDHIHDFEKKILTDIETLTANVESCLPTLATVFKNLCEQELEFYGNAE